MSCCGRVTAKVTACVWRWDAVGPTKRARGLFDPSRRGCNVSVIREGRDVAHGSVREVAPPELVAEVLARVATLIE